jgi:hypothetical protein
LLELVHESSSQRLEGREESNALWNSLQNLV